MKISELGRSKWRKSWIGGTLIKLFGEERGAVMMEYVIIAVLIAAACVVAIAMFGRTIVGMFDAAAKGATGDHTGAKEAQDATRETQKSDADAAKKYSDDLHK